LIHSNMALLLGRGAMVGPPRDRVLVESVNAP